MEDMFAFPSLPPTTLLEDRAREILGDPLPGHKQYQDDQIAYIVRVLKGNVAEDIKRAKRLASLWFSMHHLGCRYADEAMDAVLKYDLSQTCKRCGRTQFTAFLRPREQMCRKECQKTPQPSFQIPHSVTKPKVKEVKTPPPSTQLPPMLM